MKPNLDSMLEDFLSDNHVEDIDFSAKVVQSLPKKSSLFWLRDTVPAFVLCFLFLIGWKFHFLIEQIFFLFRGEFYQWMARTFGSLTITISFTVIIGLAVVAAYFAFEKIRDEVESF